MKQRLFTRNFTFLILGQITSLIGNFTLKFALSGLLVLIISLVLPFGHDIFLIGVLLVGLSVLGAFESPTVQACIPQMLSGDNLLKGNAVVNQVAAIASLVTPFLGSIFYAAFGIKPVLYAAVACFFITAFFECFIQLDYQKSDNHMSIGASVKEDFSISMRFLFREQPGILRLLLLAALASLFVAGTAVVGFPYLVRTVLGLSAEHYGVAESAMGIAAILGSLCVGLLAQKLRLRYLAVVFVAFGICLIPAGIAFLLPIKTATWSFLAVLFSFIMRKA